MIDSADPDLTVRDFALDWLERSRGRVREQSYDNYRRVTSRYLVPGLGSHRLTELKRRHVRRWAELLVSQGGLAKTTAAMILGVLTAILNDAVDLELIPFNPCAHVSRSCGLHTRDLNRSIQAYTAQQLHLMLEALKRVASYDYLAAYILANTGLRVGEGFGLQWEDVDWTARQLLVRRQVYPSGKVAATKTRTGMRSVDLARPTVDFLRSHRLGARQDAVRAGRALGPWILAPEWPEQPPRAPKPDSRRKRLRRSMARACEAADLPGWLAHPHALRHTFCSLLLQQGASPAYVQRQAGHASIQETVNTYGRWLPYSDLAEMDRLAERIGERGQYELAIGKLSS